MMPDLARRAPPRQGRRQRDGDGRGRRLRAGGRPANRNGGARPGRHRLRARHRTRRTARSTRSPPRSTACCSSSSSSSCSARSGRRRRAQLVAEPFLDRRHHRVHQGDRVSRSLKAGSLEGEAFDDAMLEVGVLGVVVLLLATQQLPGAPQGAGAGRAVSDGTTTGRSAHAVASFEPTEHRRAALDPARAAVRPRRRVDRRHRPRAATTSWPPGRRRPGPSATTPSSSTSTASSRPRPTGTGSRAVDAASPVGRTRTLPATGVGPFRLATVCCAHYSVAPLGVYRAVAEREVDLVLHLGDYIYEDDGSDGPRGHDPPHEATTLDDYRRRIAQIRADPDAQALHLRHPMVTIWDDHDLADNAWRDGAKKHDPDEHGPWADRAAAAARARQEWLPGRLANPTTRSSRGGRWRSATWPSCCCSTPASPAATGRPATTSRPTSTTPTARCSATSSGAWLHERLADTTRPWAIVASGVVVNELELSWPRPLRWINRAPAQRLRGARRPGAARRPVGRLPRRARPAGRAWSRSGADRRAHGAPLRRRPLVVGVRRAVRSGDRRRRWPWR